MSNKLKTYLLLIIVLSVLAIWSPWNEIKYSWTNLLGIASKDEYASLQVLSLGGEVDIFLDDEYLGTANQQEGFLTISPITPGEYLLSLNRKSDNNSYQPIIRQVNFEPGVDVVVGYEIGPSEDFSEGHIFYARKNFLSDEATIIDIYTQPEGIPILLDGVYIGDTPVKSLAIDTNQQHKLIFEKKGYDTLELTIFPDDQDQREKLNGLLLHLEVNLFKHPIEVTAQ